MLGMSSCRKGARQFSQRSMPSIFSWPQEGQFILNFRLAIGDCRFEIFANRVFLGNKPWILREKTNRQLAIGNRQCYCTTQVSRLLFDRPSILHSLPVQLRERCRLAAESQAAPYGPA